MSILGHSINLQEKRYGNINCLLVVMQHQAHMKLMGSNILLLPVAEVKWEQNPGIVILLFPSHNQAL